MPEMRRVTADFCAKAMDFAKWKAFAKALNALVPIDWTRVAEEMRLGKRPEVACSPEAIAYGLWCCEAQLAFLDESVARELDRLKRLGTSKES